MGASTHQIDRQIKQTRERIDENLGVLERRAVSMATRYGRIGAAVVGAAAVAGLGFLVYRRVRRPRLRKRVLGSSLDSLRDLAGEMSERLRNLPSVTLTVSEKDASEPGTIATILRRIAPAIAGTASAAVVERMTRIEPSTD